MKEESGRSQDVNASSPAPETKKVWEEPSIVLEQSLVATAQEEDPFMGPLSASL